MNVLASMKNKLAPLGLYDLDGDNLIGAELEAYACVLQDYCDELDGLLAERFVSTASGRGLEYYEALLRSGCLDSSLSGRRKSVMAAVSMKNTDNRLSSLDALKDVFGVHGSFTEGSGSVTFICTDTLTSEQQQTLSARMAKFIPLGISFTFET